MANTLEVTSTYAGFHQTVYSFVSNLARGRHPQISWTTSSHLINCSERLCPALHLRQRIATVLQQEGHSRLRHHNTPSRSRICLWRHQGHDKNDSYQPFAHRNHLHVLHQVCTQQHLGIRIQGATSKGGKEKEESSYLGAYPLGSGYQF